MAITGIGSNYNSSIYETYTAKSNGTEQATEANKTSAETNSSTRKTAADELSYLSEKYDDFCFIAANYTKGMRYGTNTTTNIAISPAFLKKMANDSELEKEYESYFEDMKRLDAENIRSHEARGRRMVAQGWGIDKNGGISRWGISEPTNKRHYGQEMTDYANKIRKEKAEKVKEQEKIKEKHQLSKEEKAELQEKMKEAGKETFGDKFREVIVFTDEDKEIEAGRTEKEKVMELGINLDMKI